MAVEGIGAKGNANQRCLDEVKVDLKMVSAQGEDTQDRAMWRGKTAMPESKDM